MPLLLFPQSTPLHLPIGEFARKCANRPNITNTAAASNARSARYQNALAGRNCREFSGMTKRLGCKSSIPTILFACTRRHSAIGHILRNDDLYYIAIGEPVHSAAVHAKIIAVSSPAPPLQ